MPSSKPFKRTAAATVQRNLGATVLLAIALLASGRMGFAEENTGVQAKQILARISSHEFHPIRDGFTCDRDLNKHGGTSLEDQDWRVRTLAVCDLVKPKRQIRQRGRKIGGQPGHPRHERPAFTPEQISRYVAQQYLQVANMAQRFDKHGAAYFTSLSVNDYDQSEAVVGEVSSPQR